MDLGAAGRPDESGWYEVRLRGRLDPRWSTWLDGMSLASGVDGTTVLSGQLADQSALHGLLSRIRDIGLPLISVTRLDPTRDEETTQYDNPNNPIDSTGA